MGGFGSPWHWLVIGLVALLLFGGRLPEVARSLGRAFNEFKRGLRDVDTDFDDKKSGDGNPPDPQKLNRPSDPTTARRSGSDSSREPAETRSAEPRDRSGDD